MKMKKYLIMFSVLLIGGCGGVGGSSSSYSSTTDDDTLKAMQPLSYDVSLKATNNSSSTDSLVLDDSKPYAQKRFDSSTNVTIKTSKASDMYVVLTNTQDRTTTQQSAPDTQNLSKSYSKVIGFRENLDKYLKKGGEPKASASISTKRRLKSVGDSRVFYLDVNGDEKSDTILKLSRTVHTEFGDKTLNIYVSKDTFDSGDGCPKKYCLNQDMVDTLGDKFLKSGSDNDIYDWVTNIYGEEWGEKAAQKISNVIGRTDEITILLTDIDGDNEPNRGIMGYFWPKDNLTDRKGSNQEVMFYIDSVMYANRGTRDYWSLTEKIPMEVISTLAHEFQHMISFYQKSIIRANGKKTTTWLDETLSCATEYLLSSKIKTYTPRQISYEDGSAGNYPISDGQLPAFNKFINNYSLTSWSNTAQEYGGAYALGAYMLQNYGGAELLHNIMQNDYLDERAILEGIRLTTGESISLKELINNCGTAVVLSNNILDPVDDRPFVFNTGDYNCKEYKNSIYCMGSINFFNYSPKPNFTTSSEGSILSNSNKYIYLKYNPEGNYNISLSLGDGLSATVIVK